MACDHTAPTPHPQAYFSGVVFIRCVLVKMTEQIGIAKMKFMCVLLMKTKLVEDEDAARTGKDDDKPNVVEAHFHEDVSRSHK